MRLRGDVLGQPLSEAEHTLLYHRAVEGSRKDAAAESGINTNTAHHYMATIFAKLGVEDLIGAFRAMGWLNPLPYGVSPAEARHEHLSEDTLAAFWARMATKDRE
jgi:DNA-binding CsgD family transcriptional regulator